MSKNHTIWTKIINQSEIVAHDMVQMVFFKNDYTWKKPGKNESRKFGYSEFRRFFHETAYLTQSLIIENIYLVARDIRKDETLSDKEKVDILFGEIELLLQENANQMSNKYGHNIKSSIDDIRRVHGVMQ